MDYLRPFTAWTHRGHEPEGRPVDPYAWLYRPDLL
jgi:hypothetical protein